MEFLDCDDPVDHKDNATSQNEAGHGCLKVINLENYLFIKLMITN